MADSNEIFVKWGTLFFGSEDELVFPTRSL